jgi:multidrug resistance efflux pump
VDQVDRERTLEITKGEALKQAELQLQLAHAGLCSALAQQNRLQAQLQQGHAQYEQAQNAVTTLEPLVDRG